MMKKILGLLVVPLILSISGMLIYFSLIGDWDYGISSFAIFLLTAIIIFLFEKIIPLKAQWKTSKNDLLPDLKHLLFSVLLFDALGKALALSFVLWSKRLFFDTSAFWEFLPLVGTLVIAIIIGELLPYLYHRISHTGNENSFISMLLWKIHSIHHLPTSLNWFKTNWIHPVNMFLNTFLKMTPLLLLGFSEKVIFLVGVIHAVIAYISHANIQSKTGFLDYLIVTPRLHHFHHSKVLEEAKNFGNIIPFWDLIFGTYYKRKGNVDDVGVVDSNVQYPEHNKYFQQILFPFKDIYNGCCPKKLNNAQRLNSD